MDENSVPKISENGQAISRAYLESLTTAELIRISDKWEIDIPYDLDRIFIIEELLEFASSDEGAPGDEPESNMADLVSVESAPLPKQYNITFIEALIRDPLWAFVFWEIKTQDKEQIEQTPDFDGYYLKISPWDMFADMRAEKPNGSPQGGKPETFTVPVTSVDTARYLSLSPIMSGGGAQGQFRVELCACFNGKETVLASSSSVQLPGLRESSGRAGKPAVGENPLIRLSGYEEFHIIRKNERPSKTKKIAGGGFHE
jgi:hypothetical protein